ncbi:MAG: GtrA family protein [Candidatus Moranbacteria bacterium]|nr:GtrA family protein [Candidatus Moranbacteria bacterium]
MKDAVSRLLFRRTDETAVQLFRYLFVGGFSTVVDMGAFYAVQGFFGAHYLVAQTIGFLLGVTANYLLSIVWVFRMTGDRKKEVALFLLIGIGGLLLSYLLLFLFIEVAHITAFRNMVAKAVTVAIVLGWNFGMRKKFVFSS